MLHAGMHGAVTGGMFRAIGNAINAGGIPSLDRTTGLYKLNPTQETDKMLRALAGSMFDGLQSTMRGETTEEQVYSYLLGAFFGGRESTATQHKAQRFLGKVERTRRKSPEDIVNADKDGIPFDLNEPRYNVELVPGFEKLSPPVREAVKRDAKAMYGTWGETLSAQGFTLDEAGFAGLREGLGEKVEIDIVKDAVKEAEKDVIKDLTPEVTAENQRKIDPAYTGGFYNVINRVFPLQKLFTSAFEMGLTK